MAVEKTKVCSWVQQILNTDDFIIHMDDTTEKGQGYIGDFFFVRVTFTGKLEIKNPLHLAIKYLTNSSEVLKQDMFVREISFYDKVVPVFERFQSEKNIQAPFDTLPKCYKTITEKNSQIIIMENMKAKNYHLHPKEVAMNMAHVQMVLASYAKLHALSFALQDQRNDVFQECTKDYHTPHLKQTNSTLKTVYDKRGLKVISELKDIGRNDLSVKFEKFIGDGIFAGIENIIDDVPNEKVITHGDCHNSNFLFQYENNDTETPLNMVHIDFQCSSLHSPMLDISTFLHMCSYDEEHIQFDQLIEFYYELFSSFLENLGSDASKLFSHSTMRQHWKRYSNYGFFIASAWLHVLFTSGEDSTITQNETPGEITHNLMGIQLSSREKTGYLERLVRILEQKLN